MKNDERWRLPDGVEELLPAAARQLEELRRQVIDLHQNWGFDLVIPPLIEFLDSLLTGSGELLDLQTFKIVDQLSGKTMGVRADMTPQVARIDAHRLRQLHLSRLFYLGSILKTHADEPGGSRSPLQLGAEIYGHAGVESDLEIIRLMLRTLVVGGIRDPYLDLGHVGVYRGLVQFAGLDQRQEAMLFDAMQRKSRPEIADFLSAIELDEVHRRPLHELAQLHGGVEVLSEARALLEPTGNPVLRALDTLTEVVHQLQRRETGLSIHVDLAELRGYSYHTGVVFAAYTREQRTEIARGGRYDDIGHAFGRARHATGYSTDLKELLHLGMPNTSSAAVTGVFVPSLEDEDVWCEIDRLRAKGERVVTALPDSRLLPSQVCCDRRLTKKDDRWSVEPL